MSGSDGGGRVESVQEGDTGSEMGSGKEEGHVGYPLTDHWAGEESAHALHYVAKHLKFWLRVLGYGIHTRWMFSILRHSWKKG